MLSRTCMHAYMHACTSVVGRRTSLLAHLCTSTSDFLSKLSAIQAMACDKLVRLDIEDFYMKGQHEILAKDAFDSGSPGFAEHCEALSFLLTTQYVFSKDLGRLFHVRCGSGMGSCHSGDISDMVLYKAGEANWALKPDVQRHFGVRGWLRYRDDIFVVIGGTSGSRREFFEGFKRRASVRWDVKCEMIGSCVNMLDVSVALVPLNDGSDRAHFSIAPYFKPTHRPLPLNSSSSHPPFVHKWPFSQVSRLWRKTPARGVHLVQPGLI